MYTINELDSSKSGLEFQPSEKTYTSLGEALSAWQNDVSRWERVLGIFHETMALNQNPIALLVRGVLFVPDNGNIQYCESCEGAGQYYVSFHPEQIDVKMCEDCHGSGYIDKANCDYIPPSQDLDDIPF